MIIVVMALLGALFNRIRGGLVDIIFFPKTDKFPNWLGKQLNALVFGAVCACLLQNWYVLPAAALGMFIGASFGWGEWVGAIVNRKATAKDFLFLSTRGLVWSSSIACALYYFCAVSLFILPIGLLMPLSYYVGSRLTSDAPRAWGFGEYGWGAILWATAATVLIW